MVIVRLSFSPHTNIALILGVPQLYMQALVVCNVLPSIALKKEDECICFLEIIFMKK